MKATEKQKRQTIAMYAKCAACDQQDPAKLQVAHLYEDAPSRRRASPATLVRLCTDHNTAQENSKYPRNLPAQDFSPKDVADLARRRRAKDPINSYASSRLAAYRYEQNGRPSKAVDQLTEAVSALRPIRHGSFQRYTLLEACRLCRDGNVDVIPRWQLCEGLCLVLFDNGRWDEAANVQGAADEIRPGRMNDPHDSQGFQLLQSKSFRRRALVKALTNTLDSRKTLRLYLDRLQADAEVFLQYGEVGESVTNLDVAGRLALEVGGDADWAHGFSEQAIEYGPKGMTYYWPYQEILWREAMYYHSKRDRSRTRKAVVHALELFDIHPVVLEPLLGPGGPEIRDLAALPRQFGISDADLMDDNVAFAGHPRTGQPLGITQFGLKNIVANILRR